MCSWEVRLWTANTVCWAMQAFPSDTAGHCRLLGSSSRERHPGKGGLAEIPLNGSTLRAGKEMRRETESGGCKATYSSESCLVKKERGSEEQWYN